MSRASMRGARGRTLCFPKPCVIGAGCQARCLFSVGAGVRAGRPVTNPTAHALGRWLLALWGPHEGTQRRRLVPQ